MAQAMYQAARCVKMHQEWVYFRSLESNAATQSPSSQLHVINRLDLVCFHNIIW